MVRAWWTDHCPAPPSDADNVMTSLIQFCTELARLAWDHHYKGPSLQWSVKLMGSSQSDRCWTQWPITWSLHQITDHTHPVTQYPPYTFLHSWHPWVLNKSCVLRPSDDLRDDLDHVLWPFYNIASICLINTELKLGLNGLSGLFISKEGWGGGWGWVGGGVTKALF